MSNLSDLIPAGASAKQLTFTDSGSGITTKKPVILKSDGTVAQVAIGAAALDSVEGEFNDASSSASNTGDTSSVRAMYNSDEDRVYFFWHYSATIWYSSGTYNGTSWSFGSAVNSTKACSTSSGLSIDVAYDSSEQKGIIVWEDGTGHASRSVRAALLTFSSGTVTWVDSGTQLDYYSLLPSVASDNNGTFMVFYEQYPNNESHVIKGTISGASVTYQSTVTVNANGGYYTQYPSIYVAEKSRYLVVTLNSSGAIICSVVQDNAGTTPTVESNTTISNLASGGTEAKSIAYDPTAETIMVFGQNATPYPLVQACTFTGSNNAVTQVGSAVVLKSATIANQLMALKSQNNSGAAQTLVTLSFSSTSTPSQYLVLSGTTPTISVSPTDLYSDTTNTFQDLTEGPTGTGRVYIAVYGSQTSGSFVINDGYAQTYTMPVANLTATNFVGIADSAISASAAGSIIVQGGTISGLSSLTTGSSYYVQTDGTFSTSAGDPSVKAGLAISTTSLLLNGDS